MNFKRNFPLAEICTLNIKEIASYYCEISDSEDIEELLSKISDKNPEASESYWEELLEDVNELLDED